MTARAPAADAPPPAVELAGIAFLNARLSAYVPGRPKLHLRGLDPTQVPHRDAVALTFLLGGPGAPDAALAPAARDGVRAAREQLRAARERWLADAPEVRTWHRLRDQAAGLKEAAAAAERRAAAHLAEARRVLAGGGDPAKAEQAYLDCLTDKELAENRLQVVGPAAATARLAAEAALRAAVDQARRGVEAAAAAEAARRAAGLTAAVREALVALVAADQVAYWAAGSLSVNADQGRSFGETAAAEFDRLD